jgi:hypothetical protein
MLPVAALLTVTVDVTVTVYVNVFPEQPFAEGVMT